MLGICLCEVFGCSSVSRTPTYLRYFHNHPLMASRQAQKRLNKEYRAIATNPPPFIEAKPNDQDILEWHYIITGPPGTPFEDGQYHGILRFPGDYPFKPPSISMVTPNGRFTCNTRLCLSMSDYHPETWNPARSVATILTGLLSFMTSDEATTGSIVTSDSVKRRFARESKQWNSTEDLRFIKHFPEVARKNREEIAAKQKADAEAAALAAEKAAKMAAGGGASGGEKPFVPPDFSTLDSEDRARLLVEENGGGLRVLSLICIMAAATVAVVVHVFKS